MRKILVFVKSLKITASILLIALFPKISLAISIYAVRVWPSEDYTRITIETDQKLKFEQKTLANPDRVLIDLYNVRADTTLKEVVTKIDTNNPHIIKARIGQFRPNIVRIVFNLKSPANQKIFTLKPIGQYRHRLVIDLYPIIEIDPLITLIQKNKEKQSQSMLAATKKITNTTPIADDIDQFFENLNTKAQKSIDPIDAIVSNSTNKMFLDKPRENDFFKTSRFDLSKNKNGKTTIPGLMTVAIDPGHGGEDPGAIGPSGTQEKIIVLDIGKRLQEKIDKEPDMQAILTRDSDFFVPLHSRVQKARRVGADLFVSIHADAFTSPKAHGSSVYTLSEHGASSLAAYWLANKENSSDEIGGVEFKKHNQALSKMLIELSTTAQIRDSLRYGHFVLDEIRKINRLHKSTVEQAGFSVLKAPDIPSILVETAFISNPIEENNLKSEVYREKIAEAIFKGIKKFFDTYPTTYRTND